jgi:hypothetical protein
MIKSGHKDNQKEIEKVCTLQYPDFRKRSDSQFIILKQDTETHDQTIEQIDIAYAYQSFRILYNNQKFNEEIRSFEFCDTDKLILLVKVSDDTMNSTKEISYNK